MNNKEIEFLLDSTEVNWVDSSEVNEPKLIADFKFIGIVEGVCGGDPVIVGTRLKPENIVAYGTKEEAICEFDLTKEIVDECYLYISTIKN